VNSTSNRLKAWSGYGTSSFNSHTWASSSFSATNVLAPSYSTGFLYGTSIGLDWPLSVILLDVKAELDPSSAVLGSWNSSAVQSCPPWQANDGSNPG